MPDFEYFRRQGLISEAGVIDAGQPHIADAANSAVTVISGNAAAAASTSGSINAVIAKLNAVIHALEDAGILLTS